MEKNKRYAILGDVHGNWEALTAVLADAAERGVTDYACVGDIVGYNPNPVECIDKIRELGSLVVRGNHDHYCSHDEDRQDLNPIAAAALAWTRDRLSDDHIAFLHDLPYVCDSPGFEIVHATLYASEGFDYVFGIFEALGSFSCQNTRVCFHGHTHVPVVFVEDSGVTVCHFDTIALRPGCRYFVNVGSVGQPRDGDPRSAYAVYDPAAGKIALHRVAYDVARTQRKIVDEGLPEPLAVRLTFGY
jgi:diadenosine tetraphosphatase ApaH/serine/threonine PP2A family protein phosphatase